MTFYIDHYSISYTPRKEDDVFILSAVFAALYRRDLREYAHFGMFKCSDIILFYVVRSFGGTAELKNTSKKKHKPVRVDKRE